MSQNLIHIDTKDKRSPRKNRTGSRLGLLLGLLMIPIVVYACAQFFKNPFGSVDTREVPGGNPRQFDISAYWADLYLYAGEGAELTSASILYVASDGTLDLNASYDPKPYADLEFIREVPRPDNAPPMGAGGSNEKFYEKITISIYEPGAWRRRTTFSSGASTSVSYMNLGMERDVDEPTSYTPTILPRPNCTLKQLWDIAIQQDTPADAVAMIRYSNSGYDFNISGTPYNFYFDVNCKLKE